MWNPFYRGDSCWTENKQWKKWEALVEYAKGLHIMTSYFQVPILLVNKMSLLIHHPESPKATEACLLSVIWWAGALWLWNTNSQRSYTWRNREDRQHQAKHCIWWNGQLFCQQDGRWVEWTDMGTWRWSWSCKGPPISESDSDSESTPAAITQLQLWLCNSGYIYEPVSSPLASSHSPSVPTIQSLLMPTWHV